jgi:dynactin 1
LRHENSYLKSQDLLHELHSLPVLSKKIPPASPPQAPRTNIPVTRPAKLTRPRSPESDISDPDFLAAYPLTESESESEESVESPPSPRTLVTESKLLYRDLLSFAARPRVVDLSVARQAANPNPPASTQLEPDEDTHPAPVKEPNPNPIPRAGGRGWVPQRLQPAQQLAVRREETRKLGRRVRGLAERAGQLGIVKLQV